MSVGLSLFLVERDHPRRVSGSHELLLLGHPSLSEKRENLGNALTASFVSSVAVSTFTVCSHFVLPGRHVLSAQ
jgi:hypothetical protein